MSRCHLAVALVVTLLLVGCTSDGDVFALEVGDCFDQAEPAGGTVTSVEPVACDLLHDHEVYAAFELDDEAWPGDEAVADAAEQGCIERFEGFVGVEYADSELEAAAFWPTEESWQERDDREVLCYLGHPDEQLTDPMQGSER